MPASRRDVNSDSWRPIRFDGPSARRQWVLPDTAFGRLGVMHAASAAADTLTTIALAKTLFFVSPDQARGKVLLYLVLTLAPFAIVSPFVGPLIDRFSGNRRWLLFGAGASRAVCCLLLSQDVNGPFLFPEAFVLLVLSKGYAVTRSSVVPAVVSDPSDLVRANSRLALIAALAGFLISIPGGLLSLLGPQWVLTFAALMFIAAAVASLRLRFVADRLRSEGVVHRERPALGAPRVGTHGSDRVRRADMAQRRRIELRLATVAMTIQRGLVGLVTFLMAFTLKREGAPQYWLGVLAGAGIAGGLLGSVLAPKAKAALDESRILLYSLVFVAVAAVFATVKSEPMPSAGVAFAVGFAAGISRLAFDSLMQRDGDESTRGAAFARLETRFQLAWVIGALVPVAIEISRSFGFALTAICATFGAVVVAGGEASIRRIDAALAAGANRWRRPDRPAAEDWDPVDDHAPEPF